MYSNVDYIADRLMMVGKIGRDMPPSWDGAKITIPVISQDGSAYVGKVLPGRGLFLEGDLKDYGITKRLPYVFEKTPIMRLRDILHSERHAIAAMAILSAASLLSRSLLPWHLGPILFGTITTYDGIISARAGGKATDVVFAKSSLTTVSSAWSSLFDTGGFPTAGAYTATPGSALSHVSAGALSQSFPNSGSNKCYILTFGYMSSQTVNMAMLVDLCVQVGSIAVAGAAATVSSAALTRYTTGAGVMMTFEVTTQLGATPANLTVSYTNQAGTAAQSTGAQAMPVSGIVGRLVPAGLGPYIQLAAGDFGVRAVATATTSANMAAGAIALNLYYPLAMVPGVLANLYVERDSTIQIDGVTELTNVAGVLGCLAIYVFAGAASSGSITGFLRTCQG